MILGSTGRISLAKDSPLLPLLVGYFSDLKNAKRVCWRISLVFCGGSGVVVWGGKRREAEGCGGKREKEKRAVILLEDAFSSPNPKFKESFLVFSRQMHLDVGQNAERG